MEARTPICGEDRAIEEFLKTIEPNYNTALDKLSAGVINNKCIYTIAGFVAYVIACSPAGMRIHSGPPMSAVEAISGILEARGSLPPPPTQHGGVSLTEFLRNRSLEVSIDPKYPQAIGINTILQSTAPIGNFKWEILHND